MDKIFKEGDVVKCKAGGPSMVIEKYHKRDVVKCMWFSGTDIRRDYFKQSLLVLVNENELKEKEIKKTGIKGGAK